MKSADVGVTEMIKVNFLDLTLKQRPRALWG